jgi:hypothetical protein
MLHKLYPTKDVVVVGRRLIVPDHYCIKNKEVSKEIGPHAKLCQNVWNKMP